MVVQDRLGLLRSMYRKTEQVANQVCTTHRVRPALFGGSGPHAWLPGQPVWMILDTSGMGMGTLDEGRWLGWVGTLAWTVVKLGHPIGGHVLHQSTPCSTPYHPPEHSIWNVLKGIVSGEDQPQQRSLADGLRWVRDGLSPTYRVIILSPFLGADWPLMYVELSRRHHLVPFRIECPVLPNIGVIPMINRITGEWMAWNTQLTQPYQDYLTWNTAQSTRRQAVFKRANTPDYVVRQGTNGEDMAMWMLNHHAAD